MQDLGILEVDLRVLELDLDKALVWVGLAGELGEEQG